MHDSDDVDNSNKGEKSKVDRNDTGNKNIVLVGEVDNTAYTKAVDNEELTRYVNV